MFSLDPIPIAIPAPADDAEEWDAIYSETLIIPSFGPIPIISSAHP